MCEGFWIMLDRSWGLGPGREFEFRKLDTDPDSVKLPLSCTIKNPDKPTIYFYQFTAEVPTEIEDLHRPFSIFNPIGEKWDLLFIGLFYPPINCIAIFGKLLD